MTVTYEVRQFLKLSACSVQQPEHIRSFLKAVEPFGLTKEEKLQLINLRPMSLVTLHVCVSNLSKRFKPGTDAELLQIINDTLPEFAEKPEDEEDEEEEEGEEAAEEGEAMDDVEGDVGAEGEVDEVEDVEDVEDDAPEDELVNESSRGKKADDEDEDL
eukprot:m.70337 g.70337  ORF g.70337 m.70337 type:complete len:159 (+) comp7871_c0_seq4:186-662(+)